MQKPAHKDFAEMNFHINKTSIGSIIAEQMTAQTRIVPVPAGIKLPWNLTLLTPCKGPCFVCSNPKVATLADEEEQLNGEIDYIPAWAHEFAFYQTPTAENPGAGAGWW